MHNHKGDPFLTPETCAVCKNGVELPKPKAKPRVSKKQKPERKAPVDPYEKLFLEFDSGARCMICQTLRVGAAYHCQCERDAIAARHLAEIEAWADAHPDEKGKLVATAAAAGIGRVSRRAGLRDMPSGVDGLSVGGAIGLVNRVEKGRAMEWRPYRPSGDPVPV